MGSRDRASETVAMDSRDRASETVAMGSRNRASETVAIGSRDRASETVAMGSLEQASETGGMRKERRDRKRQHRRMSTLQRPRTEPIQLDRFRLLAPEADLRATPVPNSIWQVLLQK
ncbi:uncharacterized protein [Littorina saxatilis]|uniref:uncharacterized protein n=1 Tax=Littorina saxatilis TaxID=31220 RepID=UPI0038B42209